jgi:transcriptional regulator with XRE-family HTH domain
VAATLRQVIATARSRRRELGWSQGELAQRLGVSRTWVQEFEAARGGASIDTVLRALGELGISLSIEIPGAAGPTPEAQPDLDLDALIDSHRDDR